MRTAISKRTWPEGDTTEHYWAEVETDAWLETSRLVECEEDEQAILAIAKGKTGEDGTRMLPIRAHTRYLRMFSDELSIDGEPQRTWLGSPA